jgi:hypothetical protein
MYEQAWRASRSIDKISPLPVEDDVMEEVMVKSEPIDPLIMDLEEEIPLDVPRVNLDSVRILDFLTLFTFC